MRRDRESGAGEAVRPGSLRARASGRAGRLRRALAVLAAGLALGTPALAQLPPVIDDFGPADRLKSERQRERIAALARRHLGRPIRGDGTGDLDVLQRLLDERIVAHDDVLGLQALGVVLGDVMAHTLPLHWVTIRDELGQSRALRYAETPALFFPVTMISKRVQNDERVRVRALYDRIARDVARLEEQARPGRRRPTSLPSRPEARANADR